MNPRTFISFALCAASLIAGREAGRADTFFTQTSQAGTLNWTNAIWTNAANQTPVPPVAGSAYVLWPNNVAVGSSLNEARLRNPAFAGVQTFPGDSLTLSTNTEVRMKQPGATLNFPGVGGNPGLILNGGVLNVGDPGGFTLAGSVGAAAGSTSYLCPGNNDAMSVDNTRTINVAALLSGSGRLVLFEGGSQPQVISCGSNTFSGEWVVKCGYLQGAATNSLGTNSITVDPKYALAIPPFDPTITNAAAGPATLEVNYDLQSAGVLTLTNGGAMILHQNCSFNSVVIEGTSLGLGYHAYAELAASFPSSFAAGGSGGIVVIPRNVGQPEISTQPASRTVFMGQTTRFMVYADLIGMPPGPPYYYQWQFQTNGSFADLTDAGNISNSSGVVPGTNGTTLTISNCAPPNAGSYRVVITNGIGSVTSSVATLTVLPAPAVNITRAVLSGAAVTLNGTGGITNGPYLVLASTNLALPLAGWAAISTNKFDGRGNFNVQTAYDADKPAGFFVIEPLPPD